MLRYVVISLLIVNHTCAQSVRLPINYCDLLPMEAQWLIKGEGLIHFEYRGNYTYTILLSDGQPARSSTITCSPDSITITTIQKTDTSVIGVHRLPNDGLSIQYGNGKRIHEELLLRPIANRFELLLNSEKVFELSENHWKYYPQEFRYNLFGAGSLENALYTSDVLDQNTNKYTLRRDVEFNTAYHYFITEHNLLRLKIHNSQGYLLKHSKKTITISEGTVQMKFPSPPKADSSYRCNLTLSETGNHISIAAK